MCLLAALLCHNATAQSGLISLYADVLVTGGYIAAVQERRVSGVSLGPLVRSYHPLPNPKSTEYFTLKSWFTRWSDPVVFLATDIVLFL